MIEKIIFCEFNKPKKVVQMPITKYFINKNIDNQTETLYWHFQLNHILKPLRIRAHV